MWDFHQEAGDGRDAQDFTATHMTFSLFNHKTGQTTVDINPLINTESFITHSLVSKSVTITSSVFCISRQSRILP